MTTQEHLGMANGFNAFVSNHRGKFYASFVVMNGDVVLGVTYYHGVHRHLLAAARA